MSLLHSIRQAADSIIGHSSSKTSPAKNLIGSDVLHEELTTKGNSKVGSSSHAIKSSHPESEASTIRTTPLLPAPILKVGSGLEYLTSAENLLLKQVTDLYHDSVTDWQGKCLEKFLIYNKRGGINGDVGFGDPTDYQQLFFVYHTLDDKQGVGCCSINRYVAHIKLNRKEVLRVEMTKPRSRCTGLCQCSPTYVMNAEGKRLGAILEDSILDENDERMFRISHPWCIGPCCGHGNKYRQVLDVSNGCKKVAEMKEVHSGEDDFVLEDGQHFTMWLSAGLNVKQKAVLIGWLLNIVFLFYRRTPQSEKCSNEDEMAIQKEHYEAKMSTTAAHVRFVRSLTPSLLSSSGRKKSSKSRTSY